MTGDTILEGGRRKAYRPLAERERAAAFRAGLAAYDRGDWFLAHELLEPAWMGSDDPAERALSGGLIKLAAAGVHAVRRNPIGVARNLAGARTRLALAADVARAAESSGGGEMRRRRLRDGGLDLVALLGAVDARLTAPGDPLDMPPPLPRRRRRASGLATLAVAGRR